MINESTSQQITKRAELTFNEAAQALRRGNRISEPAVLDVASQLDEIVAEECFGQIPEILEASEPILDHMHRVVELQHYLPCLRAGYFAAFYDLDARRLVTPISYTRTMDLFGFDCRLGTTDQGPHGTCLREESGKRYVDYYGNCPSVHAAQGLVAPSEVHPDRLLWVEGGVLLVNGLYTYVNKSETSPNYKDRLYRCSMCLKHCIAQGVGRLAFLCWDEERENPHLIFGSTKAHLAALTLINADADFADSKPQHVVF